MYKKANVAILLISLVTTCMGMLFDTDTQIQTTLSNQISRLEMEGDALYLTPGEMLHTEYAYIPGANWGFKLKGQYHLTESTSTGLELYRYRLDVNGDESELINVLGEERGRIRSNFLNEFLFINLYIKHTFYITEKLHIQFNGGLEFSNIEMAHSYNILTPASQSQINLHKRNKSVSLGPRAGLGLDYELTPHLKFYVERAYASLAILSGEIISNYVVNDRRQNPTVTTGVSTRYKQSSAEGSDDSVIGLHYESQLYDGIASFNVGWVGIAFGRRGARWAGLLVGAKWAGDS